MDAEAERAEAKKKPKGSLLAARQARFRKKQTPTSEAQVLSRLDSFKSAMGNKDTWMAHRFVAADDGDHRDAKRARVDE